ncbi:MAG: Abi family protein [Alphaproteobacteria bacterium]|nr:Abi family protein [Alphaproteobacteria bacterium]QQS57644.1 MAG: Abi family protein [Alphaproteobacteria bacterium]
MSNSAKDWKSFEEQIGILQSRGMIIDDKSEALIFLERVGYYRLSGYWYPFRKFDNGARQDDFIPETRFSDIISLYDFDRRLRLLALDAVERIELSVQVDIAYLLGKRDPFAHESPNELHGNFSRPRRSGQSEYDLWIEDYNRLVDRSKRKPFVAHNLKKYGKLPIWVAIEIFDFGAMSKLYAGMKHQDKINIEKKFGLNAGTEFETWLRGFNFIRNTAAHHSRLWNCNVLERAIIPRSKLKLYPLNNSRPFLYFCMMQSVLKVICPDARWGERFIELLNTFPEVKNQAIKLEDMGFIEGAKEWPLWKT